MIYQVKYKDIKSVPPLKMRGDVSVDEDGVITGLIECSKCKNDAIASENLFLADRNFVSECLTCGYSEELQYDPVEKMYILKSHFKEIPQNQILECECI